MQVKSIAECFCNTFDFIKLPFVIKIFVLSIFFFEWPFYTGFTVCDSVREKMFLYGKLKTLWNILPAKLFQGTDIHFVRGIDSLPNPTIRESNKCSV